MWVITVLVRVVAGKRRNLCFAVWSVLIEHSFPSTYMYVHAHIYVHIRMYYMAVCVGDYCPSACGGWKEA